MLDPRFSVRYIGRYTKRAVLAEYRITYYDGKIVRFSFKDYAQSGKVSYKTVRVNQFIGRLIRHIPDKHFPMIRHAGIFANCQKAKMLARACTALGQERHPEVVEVASWAERQTAYSGADPLQCPHCHVMMVLIASVFGRWEDVQAIFIQAGRDVQIPLPLLNPLGKLGKPG